MVLCARFSSLPACIHGVPKLKENFINLGCNIASYLNLVLYMTSRAVQVCKCLIKILFSWHRYHQAREMPRDAPFLCLSASYTTYYRFLNLIAVRYIHESRVAACSRIVSFPPSRSRGSVKGVPRVDRRPRACTCIVPRAIRIRR